MKAGFFVLCLLAVFLSPGTVKAQQPDQPDSLLGQQALDHTVAVYASRIGDQSRLYNGRHYNAYPYNFKEGTPYLDSLSFRTGSVLYDSIWFTGIPLIFDVLGQKLITKDEAYDLQLISERIGAFTIAEHRFIRIVADSINRGTVRTGFYEVLYPGRSMLLKKLYKNVLEEPTITEGIVRTVLESTDYFIKNGDGYFRVNSKRELLDLMADHKKEIQREIKRSKLKFRRQKEAILLQAAAHYDQLKK